jgi:hypothetical protein
MTSGRTHVCTPFERETIIAQYLQIGTLNHVMRVTGRTRDFVVRVLVHAGLRAKPCRHGDDKFQAAMRRAQMRGLEHPPALGPFVDLTPFSSRAVFYPAVRHSGCSSAAELCAELGDRRGNHNAILG